MWAVTSHIFLPYNKIGNNKLPILTIKVAKMDMPPPNPDVLALKSRLVARLQTVLPADAVISDETETRAYECDALTAYRCPPLCVVLPGTTQEVSAVLKICHEAGVPVVPRGSGTSLAGGALPTADCYDSAARRRVSHRGPRGS